MIATAAESMLQDLAVEVAAMWPIRGDRVLAPFLLRAGHPAGVRLTPPDVFRPALTFRADAVVLAHNHVRSTGPSAADLSVTRRLVAVGAVLGVPLLAHLVIEPNGWFDCMQVDREGSLSRSG